MISLRTLGGIDLRGSDGREVRNVLAQPKRLALLAMLAIESFAAPVRRDVLLGLFWPDSDTDRARAALRQALSFLRRELGVAFIGHGDSDLCIDQSLLACDVTDFARACAEHRYAEALDIYGGEFAAGFFIPDAAPEFDDWVERRRTDLRAKALAAATSLVEAARLNGQLSVAVQWARVASKLAPDDEEVFRSLLRLLAEAGDRAGAIRSYETFATSLMRQLAVTPARETQALIASIRAGAPGGNGSLTIEPHDTRKSVAVLTFVNMTGDPDHDFLCHGFTEELLAVLGTLRDIRIVPMTGVFGFKGRQLNLAQIRERVNVAAVLDGTIWRGGNTARVSAHLIDASNGTQLWAETYDREWQHITALQGQLARSIAGGVHVALTGEPAALPKRPTRDVEAYNLYLTGHFHWMNRLAGPLRALEFLNQAVAQDPNFALAHAALADAYNTAGSWETSTLPPWETVPKAQAAAIRALEIDPRLAEAHAALGYISSNFLYDWDAAEQQLARALSINPDYQHAYHWYSHLAMALGRVDESLHFSIRALQSDPLDPVLSIHLAWHYWFTRQYEQVLEQADRTADLDATGSMKPIFSGAAYLGLGDTSAAIEAHREGVARTNGTGVSVCMLGYSYAAGGERKLAREILKRLAKEGAARGMFGYEMALMRAALGEIDMAFDELRRAYRERSSWIPYLNVDPRLDRLRADPRFSALVETVGLARSEGPQLRAAPPDRPVIVVRP